jgi:phosphate transport system substrate-binding protein
MLLMYPKPAFLILGVFLGMALLGISGCTPEATPPNATSSSTAGETKAKGSIKVGGSSSSANLINALAIDYESTSKIYKVSQLEPGQSENIIEGVKQKIVDCGVLSRILKPSENDGSLVSREIAQDAIIVALHPSVIGVKNLTTEELKQIYSGAVTNWKRFGGPDAKIILLDRPEDESAKRLLRKHYLGADLKNSTEAVIFKKEGELILAVQSTPYSIGAFSLASAISKKLPVTRLSLNGIEPTTENVKAGKYEMVRSVSAIWHKNPSDETKVFVEYISSPQGLKVMELAGFIPVAAKN